MYLFLERWAAAWCRALLSATLPGRKDVAFIKAKHGKGAAQSGRHSGGCTQASASRWKQVLLTLLVFIALLALMGGALWQNICYNRTHYTAEFYQIHSRKLTQSCRVVFLTDMHLREYGQDNCDLVQDIRGLAPDLILLGGDLVTYGEGSSYDNMLSLCRQLIVLLPAAWLLSKTGNVDAG